MANKSASDKGALTSMCGRDEERLSSVAEC
jgi:hypothetical protein